MGTKLGPSYANLFVGFNQYDDPKTELYGRYIDDCICANTSSREELNQFITSVGSFHTWEISETSLAFLDINVSISGTDGLCASVYYKPTDSHSYLLYSSSHPSHVYVVTTLIFLTNQRKCASSSKNVAILLLRFKRPITALNKALLTSQKEKNDRIPFTLRFHPHNNPVKALTTLKYWKMILKNWCNFFATSTGFIQTWQKCRQLTS